MKKASKKVSLLLTIIIVLVAITPTIKVFASAKNETTVSTPEPKPEYLSSGHEDPHEVPTPDHRSTINFHEHQLVEKDIPDWLLPFVKNHDKYCNQYPEAEIAKVILANIKAQETESFAIREGVVGDTFFIDEESEETVGRYISYDAAKKTLRVGDTVVDLNKPTVQIDELSDSNIGKLVKEHGFDIVLSIMDRINQEPNLEDEAEEADISPKNLVSLYEEAGWDKVSERGAKLLTKIPEDGYLVTAFWTENYDHFVAIGAFQEGELVLGGCYDNNVQAIFVDGKFLSVVPEKYPISYEEMMDAWATTESYDWYDHHARREICCDSSGKFFLLDSDCMVYTWQWSGLKSQSDRPYWDPTNYCPKLGSSVIVADGPSYETWYITTDEGRVKFFELHFGSDSEQFGLFDLFEIEFKDAQIATPFVVDSLDDYEEGDRIAFIAVPERNEIWKVSFVPNEFGTFTIGQKKFDQVEVVGRSIYIRKGGNLTATYISKISAPYDNSALTRVNFDEVARSTYGDWSYNPSQTTTRSENGHIVLENGPLKVTLK